MTTPNAIAWQRSPNALAAATLAYLARVERAAVRAAERLANGGGL